MITRLRHLIQSDGRIPRLDIDVDVENGVVELLGVIPDAREHDELLALVEKATGQQRVIDHLIFAGRFGSGTKHRRKN